MMGDTELREFKVVAVEGAVGDFAVYIGTADKTMAEIASSGSKLPPEIAKYFFPKWFASLRWRP